MTSHQISREISVEVIPTQETGYIIYICNCVQTRRLLVWKVVKTEYTSLYTYFYS